MPPARPTCGACVDGRVDRHERCDVKTEHGCAGSHVRVNFCRCTIGAAKLAAYICAPAR